jgi:DNA-directed RNA polymerase subunit beta'
MAESRAFDKIRIGLASPEEVRGWSHGEVKKPETINYRTFKPERDGLFCERTFGPVKDWECHCGRYKKVKFKGIICDRCGVEVTRSKVRRERMGHIELCAPVSHIWYLKGVPSPMALLLDLSPRPLEKVIYFGSYIVTKVDRKKILDDWADIEQAIRDELVDREKEPEPSTSPLATVTLPLDALDDEESLIGRIASDAIVDPETGEIILEAGDELTQESLDALADAGIAEVEVERGSELLEDDPLEPGLRTTAEAITFILPNGTYVTTGLISLLRKLGITEMAVRGADESGALVMKQVAAPPTDADIKSVIGGILTADVSVRPVKPEVIRLFQILEMDVDPATKVTEVTKKKNALEKAYKNNILRSGGLAAAADALKLALKDKGGIYADVEVLPEGTLLNAELADSLRYMTEATIEVQVPDRSAVTTVAVESLFEDLTIAEDEELTIPAETSLNAAIVAVLDELGVRPAYHALPAGSEMPAELSSAPRMLDEIAGDDLESGLTLLQKVEKKELLVEDQFRQLERVVQVLIKRLGKSYEGIVKAGLGAAAVRELLQEIDLESLKRELETEIAQTQGPRRLRAVKRIEICRAFLESKSRPEWMVLDAIPVIPPELRPMVQLDGGRFATSDLNDLYRRIINRNNRLKKIQDIKAPESIINHEKRLLQEAVDALIDNGRRTRPVVGSNNRPLRSLSDMLKGKEGRFRKNLLGKRVDYSGRSVIVVGPTLKLNQCGLPKEMALELFKPFVMKGLVDAGCTTNIKTAKRMIDRVRPEVWDALEKVVGEHVVLLNRAPTLHRLGIQAFEPVLVDGKAIRLHPLVCAAFGADFDGDQMAVHVPLSSLAQAEGQCLMLSTRNLFKPSDGAPIVAPIQDIVLGLYYLTQKVDNAKGAGQMFSSVQEALLALESGIVHLHAPIRVRDYDPDDLAKRYLETNPEATDRQINLLDPASPELAPIVARARRKLYDTTMGRLIISQIAPWMMRYPCERNAKKNRHYDKKVESISGVIDAEMDKKAVAAFIRYTYEDYGAVKTIELLDDIKTHGFTYATRSGMSISLTDMDEPAERETIILKAEDRVKDINRRYRRGAITAGEREGQVLEAWTGASADIGKAILKTIGRENPLFMMTNSGARGSVTQITQLSGMRGLMSDPFGGIIEELPIKSNFHRGLNILEYFVSTHGQRKGLADTALRTADAGYLTRRLVDVAQDVIVRDLDCNTNRGIYVGAITEAGDIIEPLRDRIRGRVALEAIVHPDTGEVFAAGGEEISDIQARSIDEAVRVDGKGKPKLDAEGKPIKAITRVGLRSPLTCELRQGICATCYGRDMATQRTVEIGTAVGIIAAQSIGEPGTQLTMRTFHTGGVAGKNIVGVANVKQKKQEALRELHLDIERGHVTLEGGGGFAGGSPSRSKKQDGGSSETEHVPVEDIAPISLAALAPGTAASDRERSRAVQAMLKVLEEQVGGLLRVVELVEGRKPKGQAIITDVDGKVVDIEQKGSRRVIIHSNLRVDSGECNGKVLGEPVIHPETGEILLEAGTELNEKASRLLRDKNVESVVIRYSHLVPYRGSLEVKIGDEVHAGDRLTEGPLDPDRVLELQGITGVQDYMVKEVQSVYKSQGVDINDKHIEVIVRQMLKKRKIVDPGDTLFLPGQMVDKFAFEDSNTEIRENGGTEATADWLLLGITEASLATDSFLSAASFQKTTKVLADAAVKGKKDNLVGLKENVIIGRLIPAGTGLKVYAAMTVGGEGVNAVRRRDPSRTPVDPTIDELTAVLRGDTKLITEEDVAGSAFIITDDAGEPLPTTTAEYE